MSRNLLLAAAWLLTSQAVHAQHSLLDRYQERVRQTLAQQPRWATPLITTSPRLEQGFRTDFTQQHTSGGTSTWSLGGSKGLQIVPSRRIELRVSLPPFLLHTGTSRAEDGFGDVAFLMKYRLFARNEQHGNAILSALLFATVPTGKSGNGSCCATVTPTLSFGKGFQRIVFTSTLGATLPVSYTRGLGRQIVSNTALQLRTNRFVWLQMEANATSFQGGKNDGHTQLFATPGVVVSRLPIRRASPDGPGSLLLTLGAGEQIALTHFATYNHAPVFSVRLRF